MTGVPDTTREVHVQGHTDPLYVSVGMCTCGDIRRGDGISFCFGRAGSWVVPLEELRAIVREADEFRAKYGAVISAKWAAGDETP